MLISLTCLWVLWNFIWQLSPGILEILNIIRMWRVDRYSGNKRAGFWRYRINFCSNIRRTSWGSCCLAYRSLGWRTNFTEKDYQEIIKQIFTYFSQSPLCVHCVTWKSGPCHFLWNFVFHTPNWCYILDLLLGELKSGHKCFDSLCKCILVNTKALKSCLETVLPAELSKKF